MEDWTSEKTQKETNNMHHNASLARKISLLCAFLGFCSVNGQLMVRLAQELDIVPGPAEKRLPMLSSYFPYDYKPSPIYEITWALQWLGAALATLVFSGIYCLFVGLVLHLRGQLANLKIRMEKQEKSHFSRGIGQICKRHEFLTR